MQNGPRLDVAGGVGGPDRIRPSPVPTALKFGTMGLFKKKDPLSERARALNAEIAGLEPKIQNLGSQLSDKPQHPRLRSTTRPSGQCSPPASISTTVHTPVFEANDYQKNTSSLEPETTPQHFNDL